MSIEPTVSTDVDGYPPWVRVYDGNTSMCLTADQAEILALRLKLAAKESRRRRKAMEKDMNRHNK